jgi:hypothetical protein
LNYRPDTKKVRIELTLAILETAILPLDDFSGQKKDKVRIELTSNKFAICCIAVMLFIQNNE